MKTIKLTSIAISCLVALLGTAHFNTGWTSSTEKHIKDFIDDSADALKKGVGKLGDDLKAIQDYLNNYHWKGVIEDKATSGPATLKNLELNDHSRAIVVKPGEKIEAEVKCILDPEQCSSFGIYRIVIGIKGEGAQTVIGHELGLLAGKTREKFVLTAPEKPGMYQIRFRSIDALFKGDALDAWKDEQGNEPDGKTTIGMIFVKP